ncbi:MAG: hypothetical protein H8E31_02445 [Planctomycetes bacterium]|nr:hypothetical protein [Planctomycetota bacterium]
MVLLLVLVLATLVAGLATTFSSSAQLQLQVARDLRDSSGAELLAHSGLEFAQRHLFLDPRWTGNPDGIPVFIGSGLFVVTRSDLPGEDSGFELAALEIEGLSGVGRYRLGAEVEVATSDLLRNKAIAALGGEAVLHHCNVYGDMAFSDVEGGVYDWVPDGLGGGDWALASGVVLGDFAFSSTEVTGTLFKHGIVPYLPGGRELTTGMPLMMPSWDLAPYLQADPKVVVYDHVTSLSGVVVEETAVFLLDPGQELVLDDVELRGGAIIFVENDYDLRGGARNRVVLKHVNSIGGGAGGVHPNIGLVAPASVISDETGLVNTFTGLSFWHTMDNVNRVEFHGQLLVVNGAVLNNADLYFDPEVAANPPLGMSYAGPQPGARLISVRELFEE